MTGNGSIEPYRTAKSEAALGGRKFRELVVEALRHRLGMKEAEPPAARTPGPLLRSLDDLPFVKARPGIPRLNIPARRIHELEMEAELERHEASLR
jgi:hypothetical protein